jgi:hypothetical protein
MADDGKNGGVRARLARDAEVVALSRIVETLESLTPERRRAVLQYLATRYAPELTQTPAEP